MEAVFISFKVDNLKKEDIFNDLNKSTTNLIVDILNNKCDIFCHIKTKDMTNFIDFIKNIKSNIRSDIYFSQIYDWPNSRTYLVPIEELLSILTITGDHFKVD